MGSQPSTPAPVNSRSLWPVQRHRRRGYQVKTNKKEAKDMNQEIKTKWLADLRSGEFEKGKGYLKRNGTFCCLGVLCDQAEKAGIVTSRLGTDGATIYVAANNKFDESASVLPHAVRIWAELVQTNPSVSIDSTGEPFTLSSINDNDWEDGPHGEVSFLQIADMIERDL